MKTAKKEEMRKEYRMEDFGSGVRGKYYNEYQKGSNLVLLSPDVAAAFPDDDSVNTAAKEPHETGPEIRWPSAQHGQQKIKQPDN